MKELSKIPNKKIIKSFCRGVQGGQFLQKAPPLAAGGKKRSNDEKF